MQLDRDQRLDLYRTFSASYDEYTISVSPAGGEWKIWIWKQGIRGPIFRGDTLTNEMAESIGLGENTKTLINRSAQVFRENVEIPPDAKGRERKGENLEMMIETANELK